MDDAQFAELTAWISNAGLSGQDEITMVTEFCARIVAHGLPLTRAQVFIDTLHPIYGGRAYTWQIAKGDTTATEYGPANDGEMLARWQQSPFYRLIQSGSSVLRLRLSKQSSAEYPLLGELYALGITEYVAIVDRFGADAVIGEMDCVYSSWSTNAPQGFTDAEVATLRRLTPGLALAIKSATLARIAKTLVETYLGRDPGRRVLKGGIARGISSSMEAVLWYSDLHDYTRICDRARPDEIIPLLNDLCRDRHLRDP
jgi:adenylate cyclase